MSRRGRDDNNNSNGSRYANRAYHRLCSIHHDVQFVEKVVRLHRCSMENENDNDNDDDSPRRGCLASEATKRWPIIPNERCGSWYYGQNHHHHHPLLEKSGLEKIPRCYFKSTDGHVGQWKFSQKRLNLSFLSAAVKCGGCLVLDASRTKIMPDSLSRTLPIWCAVLNRLVALYREEEDENCPSVVVNDVPVWDTNLYTPPLCVSSSEHDTVQNEVLPNLVDSIHKSGAIDPKWLRSTLMKPLRSYWIANNNDDNNAPSSSLSDDNNMTVDGIDDLSSSTWELPEYDSDRYTCIVCVSCSNVRLKGQRITVVDDSTAASDNDGTVASTTGSRSANQEFIYSPGAADDEESWARGLTPALFGKHVKEILFTNHRNLLDGECEEEDAVESLIDQLLMVEKMARNNGGVDDDEEEWHVHQNCEKTKKSAEKTGMFNEIGSTGICIGTRRAGRSPRCWDQFDAIVNATMMEYDEFRVVSKTSRGCGSQQQQEQQQLPDGKFYLQLPVQEGKKDRSELERWLAVATVFIIWNIQHKRRILIHCAQGMDRSVAVAIAALALFNNIPSLEPLAGVKDLSLDELEQLACAGADEDNNALLLNNSATTDGCCREYYKLSGLTSHLVTSLLGRGGRDLLFRWTNRLQDTHKTTNGSNLGGDTSESSPFSKSSLRLVLSVIQRYHERADPSRKTMQKLNRFFLSKDFEE